MLSFFQAIVLGLVQGITEILPVSGLGHAVLIANLFNWHEVTRQITADQSAYISLLTLSQLTAAAALLLFYRSQWLRLARSLMHSLRERKAGREVAAHDYDAKLAWLLVAAAVPAILITLACNYGFRQLFASGFFAIVFVIINGVLLIKGDKRLAQTALQRPRQRRPEQTAETLAATKTARLISDHVSLGRAAVVGIIQCGALVAGLSRTGLTMLAGVRQGLEHQTAVRFALLLLTPVLLVNGLLGLPSLTNSTVMAGSRAPIIVGGLLAGLAAYFSIRFLDAYAERHSFRRFGFYCIGAGLTLLLVSIIRGAA
jgi:undecaprenyl-diphosphatase